MGGALKENYRQKTLYFSGCHHPGEQALGRPHTHRLGKDSLSWRNGSSGGRGKGRAPPHHNHHPPPPVLWKFAATYRRGRAGQRGARRAAQGRPFLSSGHRQRREPPDDLQLPTRHRHPCIAPVPNGLSRLYASSQRQEGVYSKKVGGGGEIGNYVINTKTFWRADLLHCHVNKRKGGFLAVILTLHILYTIQKYTW